jgi:hypothetical protein
MAQGRAQRFNRQDDPAAVRLDTDNFMHGLHVQGIDRQDGLQVYKSRWQMFLLLFEARGMQIACDIVDLLRKLALPGAMPA